MADGDPTQPRLVLLTGATGYVGGRLLPRLEEAGVPVRCLARRPDEFEGRTGPRTEIVQGDLLEADTLASALAGVDTAYYLVHAMGSGADFEALDQKAARNFADAARTADVKRIIYLGGLGDETEELSAHLRSRHEVGRILQESGAVVLELRASIILGTGSLSFELVRALVERLPVMITPRWVRVEAQPILITDVLAYLLAARTVTAETSTVIEIGGADRCTYGALMEEYAKQRGLRRFMVGVPFLTPHLSSLWLGLVTPVYARVGRKLISSIRNPTVVKTDTAARMFPDVKPVGLEKAIERVLLRETEAVTETHWSGALSSGGQRLDDVETETGPRFIDHRTAYAEANLEQAFTPIRQIGGQRGWYYASWLWRVRGFIDLLLGGVGLRRGRRDPDHVRVGEPLDFWRVEAYEPDKRMVLRAEMKVPGRAWLELRVEREGTGSRIHQTAIFDPRGVLGRLYWYGVYPLHMLMFRGGVKRLARRAERVARDPAAAR